MDCYAPNGSMKMSREYARIVRVPWFRFLLNPQLGADKIHLMIALFLPTGNHAFEKTVTLTNRYTNTYFCTE